MKIRTSYVSNSSSSSFILRGSADLEEFQKIKPLEGLKVFSVKELRALFVEYFGKYLTLSKKELDQYYAEIEEKKLMPDFIYWDYLSCAKDLDGIKNTFFENLGEEDYITDVIDRDYISEFIGRIGFEKFSDGL